MNQELQFAKKLEEIRTLASSQGMVLSKEQVEEAFAEIGMKAEELEPIYDYLKQKKIGVDEAVNLDEYMTSEDRNFLQEYIEEIGQLPIRTEGEKQACFMSAMAGESDGKAKTIEVMLSDVIDIAKLYVGQGVLLEDLIGEGNVALTMGVEMLGALETPSEVPAALCQMMMDAMEELIAETESGQSVDKKLVEQINDVTDAAKELAESLQRKITVAELVEEGKFTEEEVLDAIRISGNRIQYFEGAVE